MDDKQIKDYARDALVGRTEGGWYWSLVDFIAAVSGEDSRVVDVSIIKLAKVDLNKLREAGL